MRLVSCYISGFGRLVDIRYDLDRPFTAVCADNGSGKTTFAAFIKAMLYGLPSSRAKESERKKYRPWSSLAKTFGGTLVFEDEGKLYRVERSFGTKEADDVCLLYAHLTDEQIDISASIGEHFLGVDELTFERSLMLVGTPYKKDAKTDNGPIIKKLSGILSDEKDAESLKKAVDSLTKERKKYVLDKGSGGRLNELLLERDNAEREIKELTTRVSKLPELEKGLENTKDDLRVLREKIDALDAEYELARNAQAIRNRLSEYNKLKAEYEDEKKNHAELLSQFVGDLPTDAALERARQKNVELIEAKRRLEMSTFPKEKEDHLGRLSAIDISDEKIAELDEMWEQRNAALRDRERIERSEDHITLSNKYEKKASSGASSGKMPIVILVFSAVLFAIGIGLLFVSVPIGLTIALLSFVAAGASAFMVLGKGQQSDYPLYIRQKAEIETLGANAAKLEATVCSACAAAGCDDLYALHRIIAERRGLSKEKENLIRIAESAKDDIRRLSGELDDFLSVVKDEALTDYSDRLFSLSSKLSKLGDAERELAYVKKRLDAFDLPFHTGDLLANTRAHEDVKLDIDATRAQCEICTSKLEMMLKEKNELEREGETLIELAEKLEKKRDEITDVTRHCRALSLACELLQKAAKELEEGYLPKMQAAFNEYFELFKRDDSPECHVGADLALSYNEDGKTREAMFESNGRRDVAELCARLSLADALFEKKGTFVIMDDPFVNLDDKNVKTAIDALCKCSSHFGIIYLTCSSSRMPDDMT